MTDPEGNSAAVLDRNTAISCLRGRFANKDVDRSAWR
jgi:hypothetical protein